MSLKRNETYPGRFSNPTSDHPQGAFKNRSAPGAQDGSFFAQQWANDWDGFFGRLLTVAGITPNGNADTALASQYYDALRKLTLQRDNPFSDIATDGNLVTARTNLGLKGAAILDVGTTTGTVAAGDDPRLSTVLGVGQTWQDVTSQRQIAVTYTNSTGKPIQLLLDFVRPTTSWVLNIVVDGLTPSGAGGYCPVIPPGSTYRVNVSGITTFTWRELR